MIDNQNTVIAMGQKYKGKMFPVHTPSILQSVLGRVPVHSGPALLLSAPLFGRIMEWGNNPLLGVI
jgi:hypothetical protein